LAFALQKLAYSALHSKKVGKSSQTISAKPVGVGAAYQPSIPKTARFGLLMRIATTEGGSLCMLMKS
jgi:hypothetical protein